MSLQGGYAHATVRSCSPLPQHRRFRPPVLDARPARRRRGGPGLPPYNIERTGENAYRISVAVAGFTDQDLSIEVKENTLTLKGERQASEERKGEVLYQGIAARTFERRFQLADGVQVTGAALEKGLLHVDLTRVIPEAKKPRQIPIASGRPAKTIEAEVKQAA